MASKPHRAKLKMVSFAIYVVIIGIQWDKWSAINTTNLLVSRNKSKELEVWTRQFTSTDINMTSLLYMPFLIITDIILPLELSQMRLVV